LSTWTCFKQYFKAGVSIVEAIPWSIIQEKAGEIIAHRKGCPDEIISCFLNGSNQKMIFYRPMTQQVKGPDLHSDIDGSITCIGHYKYFKKEV
jgi:hypothetical protein